jgi:hypothetical protein
LATKSDVLPDWMPAVRPRSADRCDVRARAAIHCDALVEFEIGLRKQGNGGAFRGDRRSRDDGVVAAFCQAVEDAVEVIARIPHRLQGEAKLRTNRAHQLNVEAGRRSVLDEIKGRIGIGGRDDQGSGG